MDGSASDSASAGPPAVPCQSILIELFSKLLIDLFFNIYLEDVYCICGNVTSNSFLKEETRLKKGPSLIIKFFDYTDDVHTRKKSLFFLSNTF